MIKGVREIIKNELKNKRGQKVGFLEIWSGTLGSSLLGNLLTVKGTIRAGKITIGAGEGRIRAVEGTIRAGQDF